MVLLLSLLAEPVPDLIREGGWEGVLFKLAATLD
jgi:hypothetical protein